MVCVIRTVGSTRQQDIQEDGATEQTVSVSGTQSVITSSQLEYLSVSSIRKQIRDPDKHATLHQDEGTKMETERFELRREMLAHNLAEKDTKVELNDRLLTSYADETPSGHSAML